MGRGPSIEARKNATDAKRGKIFTKIIREISVAARAGGGDPSNNPRLRTAIDKGMAQNMTKDVVERAIKKAVYGDHPYGRTDPTVESINAVSAGMLRNQHGLVAIEMGDESFGEAQRPGLRFTLCQAAQDAGHVGRHPGPGIAHEPVGVVFPFGQRGALAVGRGGR